MRALSATLERRLRRPDTSARLLVEADVVKAGVIADTMDEWGNVDSLTGLIRRTDGTLELSGTLTTLIDQATHVAYITDLDRASPILCALVDFTVRDPNMVLNAVTAHLHPDQGGTGRQVTEWRCQVYRVETVQGPGGSDPVGGPGNTGDVLELVPLSAVVSVAEGGTAVHDVTFTFERPIYPRRFGRPQTFERTSTLWPNPVIVVMVWAVKGGGEPAGNVGWARSSDPSYTSGGLTIYGATLTFPATGTTPAAEGFHRITGNAGGTPRMKLQYSAFASDDATFGTNPLDLGSTPAAASEVRFVGRGQVFPGTALRYYVRNNADSAWVQFTDGQRADALGISARQTYKMRVELDTNGGTDVSPIVEGLGVEWVITTPLHDVVEVVSVDWIVDPLTLQGRTPEIRLRGITDGVHDFNAALQRLLSDNDIADLSFSLWMGHPDDDRSTWMLLDEFPIVEDTEHEGASDVVVALSALGYLTGGPGRLPRFNAGTGERAALIYDNPTDTPKEIWNDILTNQLVLPGRRIGPPPEDTTSILKKRIADSAARTEVDAVSFIAGYATTSSRGTIRAVQMRGTQAPIRAFFSADEIVWGTVTPGFRLRRPVVFADYGTFDNPDEPAQVRAFHQAAIDNLGQGRIQNIDRMPADVMGYIQSQALAESLTAREIAIFGTGVLQWSFESMYRHPELENGDRIAVECDRFVARDPNAARALRGAKWVVGRVVGVHDGDHRRFSIHVEDWADIIGTNSVVARIGLVELASCWTYLTGNVTMSSPSGGGTSSIAPFDFDAEQHDTSALHDVSTNKDRHGVPAGLGGRYSIAVHLPYASLAHTGAGSNFGLVLGKNYTTGVGGSGENLHFWDVDTTVQPAQGAFDFSIQNVELVAGDYVGVYFIVYPFSGTTVDFIGGDPDACHLTLRRMTPARPVVATPIGGGEIVDPIRRRWPIF